MRNGQRRGTQYDTALVREVRPLTLFRRQLPQHMFDCSIPATVAMPTYDARTLTDNTQI